MALILFLLSFLCINLSVLFAILMIQMHKYHRYEYKKNWLHLIMFFVLFQVILISTFIKFSQIGWGSFGTFQTIKQYEQSCKYSSGTLVNYNIACLEFIIWSAVVVCLKKDHDVFQGISKLDYLIKASIFQRYKSNSLNRRESLNTANDASMIYRNYNGEVMTSQMLA